MDSVAVPFRSGSGTNIYFSLGPRAKEKHLLIAPDTQDVSISDTEGDFKRGNENVVRRDRRKRKSGIPTCREDICVMKYPGDTAWLFSSTPGNAGKSKFHEYFHAFGIIFPVFLFIYIYILYSRFSVICS